MPVVSHQAQRRQPWVPSTSPRAFARCETPLDAAALNAGGGRGGAFLDIDLAHDFEIIDRNVRSTVHPAKLVLGDMAARIAGRVLITSSIASTMPGRSRRASRR